VINPRNIGGHVKPVVAIPPTSPLAGTVNGAGIDRLGFGSVQPQVPLSCVVHAASGALGGGPTTQTLDVKVQDSADNSTFNDYIPPGAAVVAAIPQITAASSDARVNVDLSMARRYIRAVAVTAFTGGASPTMFQFVDVTFGGFDSVPTP